MTLSGIHPDASLTWHLWWIHIGIKHQTTLIYYSEDPSWAIKANLWGSEEKYLEIWTETLRLTSASAHLQVWNFHYE